MIGKTFARLTVALNGRPFDFDPGTLMLTLHHESADKHVDVQLTPKDLEWLGLDEFATGIANPAMALLDGMVYPARAERMTEAVRRLE